MSHDEHHQGLAADLALMTANPHRRRVLAWIATAMVLPIVGCADDKDSDSAGGDDSTGDSTGDSSADSTSSGETGAWDDTCTTIPEETAGPFPGDGSNGPNVLSLDDVVRSDIRSSIGALSGTAEGVLLKVRLRLVNVSDGCTPLVGYAIYLWHCTRDGQYSLYNDTTQNYLRGVQVTDGDGVVTFTTVFPGCYPGRWPHIHFEMYPSLDATSDAGNKVATSQLALPEASCNEVYAVAGYESSATNLAGLSLDTDNVFRDGADAQLADMSGDVSSGLVASLTVGITA